MYLCPWATKPKSSPLTFPLQSLFLLPWWDFILWFNQVLEQFVYLWWKIGRLSQHCDLLYNVFSCWLCRILTFRIQLLQLLLFLMETDEPTRELRVKSTVNGNHLLLHNNNSVWIITLPGLARFQIAVSLPNNCFRCGVVSFIVINALWFFCHFHYSRPLSFSLSVWKDSVTS